MGIAPTAVLGRVVDRRTASAGLAGFSGVGLIAAAVGLVLWLAWQNEHRDLVNLDGLPVWRVITMVIATALVFLILLFCGRLVAWFACRIERFTRRFVPT